MRSRSSRLALAAALLASPAAALKTETLGGARAAAAFAATAGGARTLVVTSGQALLRLAPGADLAVLDGALSAMGCARLAGLGRDWHLIGWTDGTPVGARLAVLETLPGVLAADPSRTYKVNRVPSDPQFNAQYALAQVNAPAAWEYETGATNRVTIGVIDSGIDGTVAELSPKLANTTSRRYNPDTGAEILPDQGQSPTPACNHATRVAGVAAAATSNGSQVAGMSWDAQLVSYKVFLDADCDLECNCLTNDPGIIAAVNRARTDHNTAAYGRVVLNISLGGSGSCPGAIQTAISDAVTDGIVVVAAAGNGGGDVENPGNCSGVIPMGATNSSNQVASFSSRGTALANNGLVAPGVSVLTVDQGGSLASATGTSFASPMGAGLAALMVSAKPALTPAQVQAYMRGGAESLGQASSVQGAGRMNAYRSLRLAIKGTLADFDGEKSPIAFPNPFRVSRSGHVSFAFPPSLQGAAPTIKIYTLDGVFVREVNGLIWDGKNKEGRLVASGSYVFVVDTSRGSARGRLAVIR